MRMSKAALWATSTAPRAKAWKLRQNLGDRRLRFQQFGTNTVHRHRGLRHRPLRIDQLVDDLLIEQAAVDDAHGAELDDLVASRGVKTGGFGIEDHIGQLAQGQVAQGLLPGLVKEVELVIDRAGGDRPTAKPRPLR